MCLSDPVNGWMYEPTSTNLGWVELFMKVSIGSSDWMNEWTSTHIGWLFKCLWMCLLDPMIGWMNELVLVLDDYLLKINSFLSSTPMDEY